MKESITRILVPVDFSAGSDQAVSYATMLASRLGASMELLHIVEHPFASGSWSAEIYVPSLPQILDDLVADADERLAAMKTTVSSRGVPVEAVVEIGPPAYSIVEHAKGAHSDLIVMGTHGRTGFAHVLMGSVAERVVRQAPCPVLTVRATAAAVEGQRPKAA